MILQTVLLSLAGPSLVLPPVPQSSLEVKYKRYRDWNFELPEETFRPVGEAIELVDGQYRFHATMEGQALLLDLDDRGKNQVRISGEDGQALLRSEDGFRYGIRLRRTMEGWFYASSGALLATQGAQRLAFFDLDHDGHFQEVGVDGLLVGHGRVVSPLGTSLLLDGKLMDWAPAGDQLMLSPHQGPSGTLQVGAGFHSDAKLVSAVFRSLDGLQSFDLADHGDGAPVPSGEYELVSGRIALGGHSVLVAGGAAQPVRVTAGETTSLDWGGPVRAEFDFQRKGESLAFSPDATWYYGASGEEYTNWKPVGKSPVFQVMDRESQQEVARAVFPGSC